MAEELVITTWCDVCMSADAHSRTTATETHQISADGTTRILDLCTPHHDEALAPMLRVLELGRKPLPSEPRKALAPNSVDCPICDAPLSSRGSLGHHLRRQHSVSLTELTRQLEKQPALPSTLSVCPECGFGAKNGTGLAAHVRTTHPAAYAAQKAAEG